MPLVRRDPPTTPPPGPTPPPEDAATTLASGAPDARFATARALAGQPGAVALLGAALPLEADARVRESILMSLVRTGGAEAVEALLPYLRSDDAGLRGGALEALAALPAETASRLPALLSDPDADVRLLSCEIARRLPPDQATRLLCDLLDRETEPNVCAAAAEVLAEAGEPQAEAALLHCAERFEAVPFLQFAIKTAVARLSALRG